jgi:serine/threonine protein phosphatase PrpC
MVQANVVRPLSDGKDPRRYSSGGTAVDAAAVVHCVRKMDSNLLGVSRALGDFDYKSNAGLPQSQQAVVCTPNVAIRERAYDEDLYLILPCDRKWDIISNKDVGGFVVGCVKELQQDSSDDDNDDDDKYPRGEVLAWVGDKLLTACLDAGSRDNMSVLIMAFPASGLAIVTPSSALLSELAAPKRRVPITSPWSKLSPGC